MSEQSYFPRWWRYSMIAACVLILCSCRGPGDYGSQLPPPAGGGFTPMPLPGARRAQPMPPMPPMAQAMPQQPQMMPPQTAPPQAQPEIAQVSYQEGINGDPALTAVGGLVPVSHHAGRPLHGCQSCQGYDAAHCAACGPGTSWNADGEVWKFAEDEYLCDGGDHGYPVNVKRNFEVHGLDVEDTVVHYDTLDGRVEVVPSNRVCVYAPKFNSVRRVSGAEIHGVRNAVADFRLQANPTPIEETNGPVDILLPEQTVRQVGRMKSVNAQRDQPALIADRQQIVFLAQHQFEAYENFQIIRDGTAEVAEGPMLAKHIDAALIWQDDQPPVVLIDNQTAAIELALQRAQKVYVVDRPDGPEEMRLVKVASTRTAKPGDIVEFTLRFDNTGFDTVGNVTIIDKLTTRLEYVEGSAQMSVEGEFFTEPNEAGSLTLRWEITKSLEEGEGGIIRFKTRVR